MLTESQTIIRDLMTRATRPEPAATLPVMDAYRRYVAVCEEDGASPLNLESWTTHMIELGDGPDDHGDIDGLCLTAGPLADPDAIAWLTTPGGSDGRYIGVDFYIRGGADDTEPTP